MPWHVHVTRTQSSYHAILGRHFTAAEPDIRREDMSFMLAAQDGLDILEEGGGGGGSGKVLGRVENLEPWPISTHLNFDRDGQIPARQVRVAVLLELRSDFKISGDNSGMAPAQREPLCRLPPMPPVHLCPPHRVLPSAGQMAIRMTQHVLICMTESF